MKSKELVALCATKLGISEYSLFSLITKSYRFSNEDEIVATNYARFIKTGRLPDYVRSHLLGILQKETDYG